MSLRLCITQHLGRLPVTGVLLNGPSESTAWQQAYLGSMNIGCWIGPQHLTPAKLPRICCKRRFYSILITSCAAADAKRGERKLLLDSADRLTQGDWVRLTMSDPPRGSDSAGSLVSHLYQGLRGLCCLHA